jgi:hypothetical protein
MVEKRTSAQLYADLKREHEGGKQSHDAGEMRRVVGTVFDSSGNRAMLKYAQDELAWWVNEGYIPAQSAPKAVAYLMKGGHAHPGGSFTFYDRTATDAINEVMKNSAPEIRADWENTNLDPIKAEVCNGSVTALGKLANAMKPDELQKFLDEVGLHGGAADLARGKKGHMVPVTGPETLDEPEAKPRPELNTSPFSKDGWNLTKQMAFAKLVGIDKAEAHARRWGVTLGSTKPNPDFN